MRDDAATDELRHAHDVRGLPDRAQAVNTEPEVVEVHLGGYRNGDAALFGPLPARRLGDVVAYEMQAPSTFDPWPGRSLLERKFALLDLGVSLGLPCWRRHHRPDGSILELPPEAEHSWYVDLVEVEEPERGVLVLRDLFADVLIGPGKQPRMLDLDELADAHEAGWITTAQLQSGLRRWQRFLDRYVHADRYPQSQPTDFPPAAIRPFERLAGPFGDPVVWPE